MGLYPALRLFTPEEYLTIERATTTKSEYMDGRIYAMAGSTRGHDAIAMNTLVALQMRLRGKSCRAHSSDVRVSVANSGPYYYPDVTVVCSTEPDWRADMVGIPILICEVCSESTTRYDQEIKLKQYRLMPSVRDILFVSQFKIEVHHHFRHDSQLWNLKEYSEMGDSIPLVGLPIELPVAELYEGLGLQ